MITQENFIQLLKNKCLDSQLLSSNHNLDTALTSIANPTFKWCQATGIYFPSGGTIQDNGDNIICQYENSKDQEKRVSFIMINKDKGTIECEHSMTSTVLKNLEEGSQKK